MRGLIAGFIAGMVGIIWNLFSYYMLHFALLRWADFAAAIIWRKSISNTSEVIYGIFISLFVSALFGVVYSYLITAIKSKHIWVKGIVFGMVSWFIIFAMTGMFKVPGLMNMTFQSALSNMVSAIIWGIAFAYSMLWMDNRLKL